MVRMINFVMFILIINFSLSLGFGVNIKKWYGWVQVTGGFVLGIFMAGSENFFGGIIPGIVLALLLIWLGPIVWRRRHL